jgi:hypothetical protein
VNILYGFVTLFRERERVGAFYLRKRNCANRKELRVDEEFSRRTREGSVGFFIATASLTFSFFQSGTFMPSLNMNYNLII